MNKEEKVISTAQFNFLVDRFESYFKAKRLEEDNDEIMYIEDLQDFFKRGRSTIYNWINKGDLPQPTHLGCWSKKYLLDWLRVKMSEANASVEELQNYDPKKVW